MIDLADLASTAVAEAPYPKQMAGLSLALAQIIFANHTAGQDRKAGRDWVIKMIDYYLGGLTEKEQEIGV